jgi:mono/diheme cytochrome c family protein
MSDNSSNGDRPLIPGQVASWLGILAFVFVAIFVIAYAYVAFSPKTNSDAERRIAEKALRADTESKAKGIISATGLNADGTYRVPVETAMSLMAADPDLVNKMRSYSAPGPSAPQPVILKADVSKVADEEVMKRGLAVYSRTCIACHQPTGKGLPPVFPPLAESPIVNGDATLSIKFILHGLIGPVTVAGTTYNSMMPAVAGLNDQDISDVTTYVRASFGNNSSPVSVEQVKAVRDANASRNTPWTTAELGLK